jgi:4-hydroxybenzoate polyprenyltransferase
VTPTAPNRWWIYQRERFPVLLHSPIILAFSLSAVSYSALLRGTTSIPSPKSILVAFASSFLTFLQLRLADEFKDFDEDLRFRPYRPVPRGLIKLQELAWLWAGCMGIQLALALWLAPRLVPLLALIWLYLGLMRKEFFVRDWLKARPVLYMVSHMAIMPLVDLYATACDWVPIGASKPPPGLLSFLFVSLLNGMVVEMGRKIRSPQDEEAGVETYSFLWGRRNAVLAWLFMISATAALAIVAAHQIAFTTPVVGCLGLLLLLATALGSAFLSRPSQGAGKRIEAMSGVWSLLLYLSLGVVPLVMRTWSHR